ncbi:hypothetical protein [Bacillus altitudinis]|nr:hypothetical protein [Bacillus altitudinis]MCI9884936.1 hypothetical protein [Bacillus altitudinis]MCY7685130.1 hypothetical protein [Bacillus altitudinis]
MSDLISSAKSPNPASAFIQSMATAQSSTQKRLIPTNIGYTRNKQHGD